MQNFFDLVAQAIRPSMTRQEREAVYDTVRQAVRRLQEREALPSDDPGLAIQRHLVEETIRDVEADVSRFENLRKLDEALEAQRRAEEQARGR